jgi:two-component system cell cycle response regulator DivK
MAFITCYNETPDSIAKGQRAPVSAQTSDVCVLIVEDHEDTRFMLRTILEMRGGISVVEAEDGETAIALAESLHPNLILMDGSLPLLDGFEATRRLRKLASTSDVPIVFISGHAHPASEAKAFDAGCTDYLIKPFALRELDRVLEQRLSHSEVVSVQPTQDWQRTSVMSSMILSQQKLFGLIELNPEGTVLYSRLEGDDNLDDPAINVEGLNFFSEVAPFQNVEEFQQRLDTFNRSREHANSFVFNCDYEDGAVPVRVLLARIRERSNDGRTKSLLVHIKKAC